MYENRLKELLMILVEKKEESYSAGYLSSRLHVSKNTVRSDVNQLRHELKSNGAEISSRSGLGNGYHVKIWNQSKFDSFLECLDENRSYKKYSPKNRVLVLSMLLIKENKYIKTESLADALYLSNKQVSKDLVIVKRFLEKYKLSISSRPHYGICIEGTEYRKRLCLNNIFDCNRELLMEFYHDDLEKLEELIIDVFMQWELSITSSAVQSLTIYIAVLLERNVRGFTIGVKPSALEVQYKLPEYNVAKNLKCLLESSFHVELPDSEAGYMALLIAGNHIIDYSNMDQLPSLYLYLISKIKERINAYYDWNIQDQEDILLALRKYLYPMIVRIDFDLLYGEATTNRKYRERFLLSYFIGMQVADVINQILNCHVTDFDILNIATIFQEHINKINKRKKTVLAVTASDGEGLIGLAKSLMLQDFGIFIKELDFRPTYKLGVINKKDYDVFLDLDDNQDDLIGIFTENGYMNIRKKLCNTYLYESQLDEICSDKRIRTCKAKTVNELITNLNKFISLDNPLLQLERKIVHQTEISSTAFSSGVIFIALNEEVRESALYLLFSEYSILYEDLYIRGVILMLQNPKNLYKEYPIYEEIGKLVGSNLKLEKLLRSCTYENLKNIMGVKGNV